MATQIKSPATARTRLSVTVVIGLLVAWICGVGGNIELAPLAGWDVAALLYGVWALCAILPLNAEETKRHAISENPGRATADALLLIASIASLVAVLLVLFRAGNDSGLTKVEDIALGLGSVVISWAMVHLTFLLRYARLYYGDPEGGINFNQTARPSYSDFAYLAFTIGMTYQVSDTNFESHEMRMTAFKHALLSFIFGTVIIATTINTLASLTK